MPPPVFVQSAVQHHLASTTSSTRQSDPAPRHRSKIKMIVPHFVTLPASPDPSHLRPTSDHVPVKLAYSHWGPRRASTALGEVPPADAPVLVFLPSEGTDARSVHREQLTCTALLDRFHLIALDLRGCGHSSHPMLDMDTVHRVNVANALAQDLVAALDLLPAEPLRAGPDGKSRLTLIATSVTSYVALRAAAKLGSQVAGVVLISPAAEVENESNRQSFDEMVEAWHSTNADLVDRFPDPATLLRMSPSVKVPLLVSGGFQARLLNDGPWPPKLLASLVEHWRRRWLSADGASKDLELFVHAPCALREPLAKAEWERISAHVLVIRGNEGQPNGNGQEKLIEEKAVNAASFGCAIVPYAPLLVSVTHAAVVNSELLQFASMIHGLDLPDGHLASLATVVNPQQNPAEVESGKTTANVTPVPLSPPAGLPRRLSDPGNDGDVRADAKPDSGGDFVRQRTESLSCLLSVGGPLQQPMLAQAGMAGGVAATTPEATLRTIMDTCAIRDELRRLSADANFGGLVAAAHGPVRERAASASTIASLSVLSSSLTERGRAASDASSRNTAQTETGSDSGATARSCGLRMADVREEHESEEVLGPDDSAASLFVHHHQSPSLDTHAASAGLSPHTWSQTMQPQPASYGAAWYAEQDQSGDEVSDEDEDDDTKNEAASSESETELLHWPSSRGPQFCFHRRSQSGSLRHQQLQAASNRLSLNLSGPGTEPGARDSSSLVTPPLTFTGSGSDADFAEMLPTTEQGGDGLETSRDDALFADHKGSPTFGCDALGVIIIKEEVAVVTD